MGAKKKKKAVLCSCFSGPLDAQQLQATFVALGADGTASSVSFLSPSLGALVLLKEVVIKKKNCLHAVAHARSGTY